MCCIIKNKHAKYYDQQGYNRLFYRGEDFKYILIKLTKCNHEQLIDQHFIAKILTLLYSFNILLRGLCRNVIRSLEFITALL